MAAGIDVSTLKYTADIITESGARFALDNALLNMDWEEQQGDLAQRANFTVRNAAVNNTWIHALAKLNCVIRIRSSWNGGSNVSVFDGNIWDWRYVSETQKELSLTAYDPLIRLQQSQDFKYYSAGLRTQDLLGDICADWGIPLSYEWSQQLTHAKKVFNGKFVGDMITGILEEVRQQTGEKYVVNYSDGQLRVKGYGTNDTVYLFGRDSAMSTSNRFSMNNLVTRVKVLGKQDDDGRAPVEAVLDGDTSFGVLQAIVRRDGTKTLEAAMNEADAVLATRGKPVETTQINVPDVPTIRGGGV